MTKHYLLAVCCLFGWLSHAQTITFADPVFKESLLMGVADINSQYIAIGINNDNEIQVSEASWPMRFTVTATA